MNQLYSISNESTNMRYESTDRQYISPEYRELILEQVKENGMLLEHVGDKLEKDIEINVEALLQNSDALIFVNLDILSIVYNEYKERRMNEYTLIFKELGDELGNIPQEHQPNFINKLNDFMTEITMLLQKIKDPLDVKLMLNLKSPLKLDSYKQMKEYLEHVDNL